MDSWIVEHRFAIWIIGEALMIGAGGFAIWSICRDVRRAWPQIVAAFTEEETTDDDA